MFQSLVTGSILRRSGGPICLIVTSFAVSACANSGGLTTASITPDPVSSTSLAQIPGAQSPGPLATASVAETSKTDTTALEATASTDSQPLLKKARQLRLAGKKARALKTLDDAKDSETSAVLVKERGMLALEVGQLAKAEKLLTRARDEHAPDWRVHSALGATFSARGNQQAAQLEFSKALALAPDHPSVLNNLALSYALDGNHAQAETLLRQAATHDKSKLKTKQNLALLLGLNGDIQEAKRVSALVLPPEKADANVSYFATLKRKSAKVSKAAQPTAKTIQSAQVN